MKNIKVLLCILLFACCKSKSPDNADLPFTPKPPVAVVKVMTYNIHTCNPPSKPADYRDIPAIANAINLQQSDLVALQEVDVHTNRSGIGVDQAKEIARLTGMNYFFTKAIDYVAGSLAMPCYRVCQSWIASVTSCRLRQSMVAKPVPLP